MKATPMMEIKRESMKEKLEKELSQSIENINVLHKYNDYSNMIRSFATAIIAANEILDITDKE